MAKGRGRPFEPGNQYGSGRPRGSRNKNKSDGDDLLRRYEEQLIARGITKAMEGDTRLLNTFLNRLLPPEKRRVKFPMSRTRTIQDIHRAHEQVNKAVSEGVLTPTDGASVSRMLEAQARILEKTDTVLRLEKLEQRNDHEDQHERGEVEDHSSPMRFPGEQ